VHTKKKNTEPFSIRWKILGRVARSYLRGFVALCNSRKVKLIRECSRDPPSRKLEKGGAIIRDRV
jgi:hypothetical protein